MKISTITQPLPSTRAVLFPWNATLANGIFPSLGPVILATRIVSLVSLVEHDEPCPSPESRKCLCRYSLLIHVLRDNSVDKTNDTKTQASIKRNPSLDSSIRLQRGLGRSRGRNFVQTAVYHCRRFDSLAYLKEASTC